MEQAGTRKIKNELRWVTREELKKLYMHKTEKVLGSAGKA